MNPTPLSIEPVALYMCMTVRLERKTNAVGGVQKIVVFSSF